MSRHALVRAVIAVPLAAWLLVLPGAPQPAPPHRPNIVLVVVDAMRADELGVFGSPAGVTPHVDRLAAGGLTFTRMASQAPWTGPAFASIISSRYPSEHGEGARTGDSANIPTLAECLRDRGYRTAAFLEADSNFLRRGFDCYDLPAGDHHARFGNPDRNGAAVTFARARSWIDASGPGPFFVLLHTFEAHDYYLGKAYQVAGARARQADYRGPFTSWRIRELGADLGAELIDDLLEADASGIAFVRARYQAGIQAVDAEIGTLADRLRRLGLDRTTVLAVTSDHGEGFSPDTGRLHHGGRLHEDLLHVPFVVAWPGHVPAGHMDGQVQSVDIMPTLLDLAGAALPAGVRGRSLLQPNGTAGDGYARYRAAATRDDLAMAEESVWEVLPGGRRVMSTTHQVAGYYRGAKLIRSGQTEMLFDLDRDPLEQSDLAAARPHLVQRLKEEVGRSLRHGGTASKPRPPAELMDLLRSLGYIQ